MIEEGSVSVEAQFVDVPIAQRAVEYPVNVASSSSNWCSSTQHRLPSSCQEQAKGIHEPFIVPC
jgi:hypothetical protein